MERGGSKERGRRGQREKEEEGGRRERKQVELSMLKCK
jgi:hypothetical protein